VTGYLDLAEKDVAGFYEPGSGVFYLLDHVPPDQARGTIAHELTHALEDQHYDLQAVSKRAKNDDHATAITAVVEGSATAVMLAFLGREENKKAADTQFEKQEASRAERLKIAPSFTQRSLLMPYMLGFTFLLRGKPWEWVLGDGVQLSDIDAAYKNPPHLTRQILHPDQYWVGRARYEPQQLTLPDLSPVLGAGWAKMSEGSIGELGLAVLTGSRRTIEFPWALFPSNWTNIAADGTVGDVFQHYAKGDCLVTILLTRWETLGDAEQFERALVNRGKHAFRFGVNFIVIAGDVDDKAEALAKAAFQSGRMFWPTE
jgi:hypothetical protein